MEKYCYCVKGYVVRWFYSGKSHAKKFDTEESAVRFAREKQRMCASGNVLIIQERYIEDWAL